MFINWKTYVKCIMYYVKCKYSKCLLCLVTNQRLIYKDKKTANSICKALF